MICVERDVPCAKLAVDGLNDLIKHLLRLKAGTNPPVLLLKKVFVSQEFSKSVLREGDKPSCGGLSMVLLVTC
jgi:hypothetical protein